MELSLNLIVYFELPSIYTVVHKKVQFLFLE